MKRVRTVKKIKHSRSDIGRAVFFTLFVVAATSAHAKVAIGENILVNGALDWNGEIMGRHPFLTSFLSVYSQFSATYPSVASLCGRGRGRRQDGTHGNTSVTAAG